MDTDTRAYLADLARRLDQAGHGEKGRIKDDACRLLGWSAATLHARLRSDVGWQSGRKVRADKGRTRVGDTALQMVAAALKEGRRANGKQILGMADAAQILEANGTDLPVTNQHLNRLLRNRGLSPRQQAKAKAYTQLASLHPNHVHQVDPSLCVLYYLPNGEQHIMEADRFYKNKWENYAKVALKVWRYVLWDHTTSMIVCRYYESAGESTAILFDFLCWAWGRQPGREFHGVSKTLLWDKGSANTSGPVKSLLLALEVEPIEHAKGAANVKGGVEGANNIVECKFESRLKFEPVHNVEQLNAAVLAWQNAFNADLIPRQDNRLARDGMVPTARLDLWRRITSEQLRLLPPVEACRATLAGKADQRQVKPNLRISYRHPQSKERRWYDVRGLDGVCVGDTVTIQPLLFGDCAIRLSVPRYDGDDLVYRLEAMPLPNAWGFAVGAPVIGQEYRALPETADQKAGKALDRLAYPDRDEQGIRKARDKQEAPFDGRLNAHSHLAEIALPAGLPRRGTQIGLPETAMVEARPFNHAQIGAWCAIHVPDWDREKYQQMMEWYPDGLLEADLDKLAARFRGGLRLVAGL